MYIDYLYGNNDHLNGKNDILVYYTMHSNFECYRHFQRVFTVIIKHAFYLQDISVVAVVTKQSIRKFHNGYKSRKLTALL
jgi:hypothetical protein